MFQLQIFFKKKNLHFITKNYKINEKNFSTRNLVKNSIFFFNFAIYFFLIIFYNSIFIVFCYKYTTSTII